MKRRRFKMLLVLCAFLIVALVAFFYPEHVENVSRALMLVLGVL